MDKYLHVITYRFFLKCFLALCFALLFTFSFGQIKFFAAANDRTIGKNDYLQIQFTVENAANVESITPPSFKNFAVVSGPNHQSSMSNINGNIRQSLSVVFVLQPLKTGSCTIGSATAKADGKEFRSNPLNIQVTNSTSSNRGTGGNSVLSPFGNMALDFPMEPVTPRFDDYILKNGENIAEKIKRNLFVKIDVNKKSCYIGEPIVVVYKLFTRLKSESNVLKSPSFNGFSVSELEIPDNYSLKTEKFNGREYNVYTLRKVQLYPLQSGLLRLDPVEVKNKVTFLKSEYAGKRRDDIFYDMLRAFADETAPANATEQQIITVTCDTLNINVKPLPTANKPLSFKGAVGYFKIVAELEKNKITTDDAGSLKVIISGGGNIQLINAPDVSWAKNMEGFESKSFESLDKFSVPMKGDKVFVYPFTVSAPGNYIIPSINFSYFDVSTQSYKIASTQPLTVQVAKGTGNKPNIISSTPNNTTNKNWYDLVYEYRVYLLSALGLAGLFFLLFVKRKAVNENNAYTNNPENVSQQLPEYVIPLNPLTEVEEKLSGGNTYEFYKALDVSFHKYLSEKLQVPAEELNKKKINERMDKCNVGVGTTLLVNSLLEDIELNLYAPAATETQMQEVYEKASEAVSLLDKQIS